MCEITRRNFEEKYNEIIDDLHSALFISIDCEFTGLFDDYNRCSLFDSPKVRFQKLQNCLEKYHIIQFGLSTFQYDRTENSFLVSTYNFYLTPAPVSENENFTCQIGSIEFLCKHKFDFNKSFYDGVYYMNKSDEGRALRMIENGSITKDCSEEIHRHCSVVSEWSASVPVGSEMFLDLSDERQTFVCLMHQEIRKRFPQLWTYFVKNGIKIKKLENSQTKYSVEEDITLKKKIFDSFLGFSKIIKEIENLKKPIVGHNFLLDLIKIYQQFYNRSQVSYRDYKRALNDLFPSIYDTKHMSFILRTLLSQEDKWNSNSLSELYQYFKSGKGSALVVYTPWVKHKNGNYDERENFHEAGFDSYVTGFCFLKMAHTFSLWSKEKKSFQLTSMPTSGAWLLGAVSEMKNKLNISRGQVNHIVIDGPDPRSTRPGLLYIQSRRNEPISLEKIFDLTAKHGLVDIQVLNRHSALMAASNKRQLNDILESFKQTDDFIVSEYNFFKDSFLGRTVLSGIVASAVLATVIALKHWKSKGSW